MSSRLVELQGDWYWWIPDSRDQTSGVIAPLERCDARGNPLFEVIFLNSFAHVFSGKIVRNGEVIGALADLSFVDASGNSA